MHPMTAANLRNAYGGESMAHMRYRIWSGKAVNEGFPNIARLFRAIASAEMIHAGNHFRELGTDLGDFLCSSGGVFGLGTTSQNLQGGINGETFEVEEMYPVYLEGAKLQGEAGAQRSFQFALAAEKTHADLFHKAKEAVDAGNDMLLGPVHICQVCGGTHEGELPDSCPICGARREQFQTFA